MISVWSTVGIGLAGVFAFAACGDEDAIDAPATGGSHSSGGHASGGESHDGGPSGGTSGSGGGGSGGAGTGGTSTGGAPPATGGSPVDPPDGGGDPGPLQDVLTAFSPLRDVPADLTNRFADDARAAALGQSFFFDKKFSGPLRVDSPLGVIGDVGKVSCASCHDGPFLDDKRSSPSNVSLGTDFHTRNAPALVNSSFYRWTNWGGRFATQWELPIPVTENPATMNGNRLAVVHRIFSVYRAEYAAVFGALPDAIADTARFPAAGKPKPAPTTANPNPPDGPWEAMTADDRTVVNRVMANYGKALAAYVRRLVSRNAPLDRFVAGDGAALGAAERRGAKIFIGKGACSNCHSGPHLSDDRFHRLNVPQVGAHVPATDDGRSRDAVALLSSAFNPNGAFSDDQTTNLLSGLTTPMPAETVAAFRTPGLRGVAQTAPYMHSGQLATLEDVVDFYASQGDHDGAASDLPSISLDDGEKADLVAFLKSLTGEAVAAPLLSDTSKP